MSFIELRKEFGRFEFFWTVFSFVLVLFLIRIIDMQLIKYAYYSQMAEKNKTQVINKAAPRGNILTSDAVVVASNKASYSLIYFPNSYIDEGNIEKLSSFISRHAQMDKKKVLANINKSIKTSRPTKIAERLGSYAIMRISELKNFYPGLQFVEEANRYYPYDSCLSMIIGYMGKIDSNDWKLYSSKSNYSMDSFVGKSGLEKVYEERLKGKDGGLYMEVDHKGRLVRVVDSKDGAEGDNIFLTVDFKLQKAAEDTLASLPYKKGAAVAIDPSTGKILVYAVKPGFNPNIFVEYSEEKTDKKQEFDEFNLAIHGTYPPASVFKIFSTIAALESGRLSWEEKFYCPGYYDAGSRVFKCWEKKGHKEMDMISGLAHSCDVYYYNAAVRIGPLEIEKIASKFGIGSSTKSGLLGEKSGNLFGPTMRAKRKSYWFIGDTLNLAIGQGETLVTPMQMAVFASALANKGLIYKPYYIDKIIKRNKEEFFKAEPELLRKVVLKDSTWDIVYKSLKAVVEEGTGKPIRISGLEVFGKTGTAQNPHGKDHAWFICFAGKKDEQPKIAIAVLVEHGEHGSTSALSVAKSIVLAAYDVKKNDIPVVEGPVE